MKNHSKVLLSLIVTVLASVLVASPALAADTGKLTVKRSPKFGKGMILDVYLDGKRVGLLQRGSEYNTSLPPGSHEVKVQATTQKDMNQSSKHVRIVAGKDTTLTAGWDGQRLTLQ